MTRLSCAVSQICVPVYNTHMKDAKPESDLPPSEKFRRFAKAIFAVPKAELEEVMAKKDAPKQKRGPKPKKKAG